MGRNKALWALSLRHVATMRHCGRSLLKAAPHSPGACWEDRQSIIFLREETAFAEQNKQNKLRVWSLLCSKGHGTRQGFPRLHQRCGTRKKKKRAAGQDSGSALWWEGSRVWVSAENYTKIHCKRFGLILTHYSSHQRWNLEINIWSSICTKDAVYTNYIIASLFHQLILLVLLCSNPCISRLDWRVNKCNFAQNFEDSRLTHSS